MTIQFQKKDIQVLILSFFVAFIAACRYTIKSDLGDILFTLEIAIFILFYAVNYKTSEKKSFLFWMYFIFIIYRLLVCYVIAHGIAGDLKIILYREFGVLLVFTVIVRNDNKEKIIIILRNIGIINSVLGVIEFVTKDNYFTQIIANEMLVYMKNSINTNRWRVRTFFIHPIICAAFLTVTWIVLLYYPLKGRMANFLTSLCIFISLIGTKSRSSWISFSIVTVLFFIARYTKGEKEAKRDSLYWIIASIAMLVIFIILLWNKTVEVFNSVFQRIADGLDLNNAGNYNRVVMIKMGVADWVSSSKTKKIFGHGSEYAINFLKKHSIRGWNRAVDNSYITLLMNYGLIGITQFLLILIGTTIHLFYTSDKKEEMAALSIISIMASGFFYDIYGWFTCTICISLFLTIIVSEGITK